jgi:hypothetical protein
MKVTRARFNVVEEVVSPENALVIVGAALDGPSNRPFTIDSGTPIEEIIGEGRLSQAYNLAYRAGTNTIIIYRINGEHAQAEVVYSDPEGLEDFVILQFTSVCANDYSNNIEVTFETDRLVVKDSEGLYRNYYYYMYPSAQILADAINMDSLYGLVEFTAYAVKPTFDMSSFKDVAPYKLPFTGGSSEAEIIPQRATGSNMPASINLLKERLAEALFGTDAEDQEQFNPNSTLGLMKYGLITLVDMFHDDEAEFSKMLANFCYQKSNFDGNSSVGVIGTRPIFNPTKEALTEQYERLMDLAPLKDAEIPETAVGSLLDNPYAYLEIVVGDNYLSTVLNETPEPISLAYSYAATRALLPYSTPMTNKGIRGISEINEQKTKEDIANLFLNGYISIVSSVRKGYVPYMATTAVGTKSYPLLGLPHVVRIAHAIIDRIVDYLDTYIGEPSTPVSRKRIQEDLNTLALEFVTLEIIRSYSLAFEYSDNLTQMRVSLGVIPQSVVGSVTSSVTMPFSQGAII